MFLIHVLTPSNNDGRAAMRRLDWGRLGKRRGRVSNRSATWTLPPPLRNIFTKFKFIKQQSRYFSPVQITIMQKQSTSNQLCAPVSHKSSVKLHTVICAFCQTSPHISQDSRRIANKWQSLSINLQACMNSWHLPRANKVQCRNKLSIPVYIRFLHVKL